MKQFRVVIREDLVSDWFNCEDFTVETMNSLANLLKYDYYQIEYKEI